MSVRDLWRPEASCRTSPLRRMAWPCVLAGVLLWAACSSPQEETARRPSEIIDVQPMIEEVETSGDPQAVARKPQLVGAMPSSFPSDLPLFLPASLVDFGTSQDGSKSVSLATSVGQSRVRQDLMALLTAAGWRSEGGTDGSMLLSKDGRSVRLRIDKASTGTVYRFEY